MNKINSIIALTIVVFIPFGLLLWMRYHQPGGFAGVELIAYPLLFGGAGILVLGLVKRYFLKEPLSSFNPGKGTWYHDLAWGVVLAIVYFVLFYVERLTLSGLLQFRSNTELLGLMLDIRKNPVLVVLWFGPVLWIGIALFEELIRVFILTTMWKWSQALAWGVFVIFFSALINGLAHVSQGPYGIVTIGIQSLVAGFFFFRYRRLMPLVYAHVLYDGIQVAALLLTYPSATA